MNAEQLGDGRAGDIGIQNAAVVAAAGLAQASRALVMLLPTPPLPETTADGLFTLLLGLGASCCETASQEEQAALQLEQSWVHSSLILFVAHGRGGTRAVRFLPCSKYRRGLAPCLTTVNYAI